MDQPFGAFSEAALEAYQKAVAEKEGVDFAEGEVYDFTRCMRADGSIYGTRGKCKKGSEAGAKEPKAAKPATRDEKVGALREKVAALKASGDKKKLAEARGDLQGQERMRKIEGKAAKEGKTPDDVIRERNAAADKKVKARLREKYPQLAGGAEAKPKRKLATSAEAKSAWQETQNAAKAAKAEVSRVKAETKGDKSPEAKERLRKALDAQDKAETMAVRASDKYFAAKKREDRAGMTPEQRKLEREADKLTKDNVGGGEAKPKPSDRGTPASRIARPVDPEVAFKVDRAMARKNGDIEAEKRADKALKAHRKMMRGG
jgi:hypothetical protein